MVNTVLMRLLLLLLPPKAEEVWVVQRNLDSKCLHGVQCCCCCCCC